MQNFLAHLRQQRHDDHRYYHHNRINQSLHFVSALSFLVAYVWLFIDPVVSAWIGWLVSMTTRQSGHFFFEPLGYDAVNQASQAHKEAIKVGYNLRRKVVLLSVWALVPAALLVSPDLLGAIEPAAGWVDYARQVGAVWLTLGAAALLFRTVQLFFIRDLMTGLVWMTKILTDPFHDAWLYRRAPAQWLRGELYDPGHDPRVLPSGAAS